MSIKERAAKLGRRILCHFSTRVFRPCASTWATGLRFAASC